MTNEPGSRPTPPGIDRQMWSVALIAIFSDPATHEELRRGIPLPPKWEAALRDDGHAAALLDLARSGREQDFRELARSLGTEPQQINGAWTGMRLYLAKGDR